MDGRKGLTEKCMVDVVMERGVDGGRSDEQEVVNGGVDEEHRL